MNITPKNFKNIQTLLKEKYISKKEFGSNNLLKAMLECNSVYIDNKPQQIYLNDEQALMGMMKANGYKTEFLDYFANEQKKQLSRDEIAHRYTTTKQIPSKSFNGLMVNVLEKIEVTCNGKKSYLYPNISGMGLFIHYQIQLELNEDTIVVGIENPQVLWYINRYKYLFSKTKKYLFLNISEYKTNYHYKWLENIHNEYIHFGDFDLAGINIYLNTILPKIKNVKTHSFLIPNNIYDTIEKEGCAENYSKQSNYINIESKEDTKLQELISFIKNKKLTLEQEKLALFLEEN